MNSQQQIKSNMAADISIYLAADIRVLNRNLRRVEMIGMSSFASKYFS